MCFFFFFRFSGGRSSFSAELSAVGDGDALSPSRSETAELSTLERIRRDAPDLAEIVEKVSGATGSSYASADKTPSSSLLRGQKTVVSPASVLSSDSVCVKRERLSAPQCSAKNPIVISDDEEEDATRAPRSERSSPRLISKSAGVSQVEKSVLRSKQKKSKVRARSGGVPNVEASSEVGAKSSQEVSRNRSVLLSRNDLYYDEKDREELASWAEFPREVELNRRHELIVRDQLREELLGSNGRADPVGSLLLPAVQSPQRGRLVRRVGEIDEEEVEENRAAESNKNDAENSKNPGSVSQKRGRRCVLTSPRSGDEESEPEVNAKNKFAVPARRGLSSQSILGRRGLSIPPIPMAARGARRTRRPEIQSPSSPGRLGESSEDEGSIMTLRTGENVLSGASKVNEQSRLAYLSQRQADLMTELSKLQRQQEEEEKVLKEREEARKKAEEERDRRREAEEKREKERQQRVQEETAQRQASTVSPPASSSRRRGRVPVGVASESQIAVSIRPLRPSATLLSIAARGGGVTESAWLPLRGAIRPTVGDDVVLGRGLTATADAIRPMHMEFFLPR